MVNKKGIRSPHLKFPYIVHSNKYIKIPEKIEADKNPAFELSKPINILFKKGFYGIDPNNFVDSYNILFKFKKN